MIIMKELRIIKVNSTENTLFIIVKIVNTKDTAMFIIDTDHHIKLDSYPKKLHDELYTIAYQHPQPIRSLIVNCFYFLSTGKRYSTWIPDDYQLNML